MQSDRDSNDQRKNLFFKIIFMWREMAFKRLKKDHSPCGTPKFLDGSVSGNPHQLCFKKMSWRLHYYPTWEFCEKNVEDMSVVGQAFSLSPPFPPYKRL